MTTQREYVVRVLGPEASQIAHQTTVTSPTAIGQTLTEWGVEAGDRINAWRVAEDGTTEPLTEDELAAVREMMHFSFDGTPEDLAGEG